MPKIQMSIKQSYNMTPNQRKLLAEKRNIDTEVVEKSGKKVTGFIFMGIGVVILGAIAGIVVAMGNGSAMDGGENSVFTVDNEKSADENVSNVDTEKISEVKPENDAVTEIVKRAKNPDVSKKTEKKIKALNPNTKFAQNFFERVMLIEPGLPPSLKREMLKVWAGDVASISLKWRDFSEKAKDDSRWGNSRKAAELADDWGYLAEVFAKDVPPDDREYLRDIVADLIKREATLKKQCSN